MCCGILCGLGCAYSPFPCLYFASCLSALVLQLHPAERETWQGTRGGLQPGAVMQSRFNSLTQRILQLMQTHMSTFPPKSNMYTQFIWIRNYCMMLNCRKADTRTQRSHSHLWLVLGKNRAMSLEYKTWVAVHTSTATVWIDCSQNAVRLLIWMDCCK